MTRKLTVVMLAAAGAMMAGRVWAEEPATSAFSLEYGADVVTSYIWRGQELGGFSVQPYATLTYDKANLSLGIWASAELFEKTCAANMTEFDVVLSWNPIEALTIGLSDYYLSGYNYFSGWRFNRNASHNLEANLAYDFGPVALSLNTCLTGPDHTAEGDRNYSTYAEVSAPFTVSGVACSATVGACLMEDHMTAIGNDKFNVCNLSLSASKEVAKLPLKCEVVFNPQTDNAYFVVGLSF